MAARARPHSVERTPHTPPAAAKHVRVDHRHAHSTVPEQL